MGLLEGKTAIVTGGGTGIGLSIAERFHREGAFVAICGRRVSALEDAVKKIDGAGTRMFAVAADITREEDIVRLLDEVSARTGRIDIIVNNAGVMRFGRLHETPLDEWELMMRTNAWGPWRIMVNCAPYLRKSGGGSIVNISSIAGIKAFPNLGIYCASKAALQTISQVMAIEAAADNIRVNCILPGLVEDTELSLPIFGGMEGVQSFWDRTRPLHPLGRNGKPEDITEAALFFASEQSSWITGTLLSVDGGRHLSTNRPG
jgi:NAD(P)-dependent dehydrogenase (short-subunit alcohol dehydrogenase family)